MSYKILEQNGIDNENIDGGAFNNFAAGNRDGIVGGVLAECSVTAVGNTIGIAPGELILHGFRVKITAVESLSISSAPSAPIRYQVIAQISLQSDKSVEFTLFVQEVADLIQDELYAANQGTYQVEIGRFTHNTDGSIEDLSRTLDIIYGGTGSGGDFEIGEVNSNIIDATLPAEVDINKRVEDGKNYIDFDFFFPDTQEVLQQAVDAKDAAESAKAAAETAAAGAETAKNDAEDAAAQAGTSASAAQGSAGAAASSASQAAGSATQAAQAETAAENAAQTAQTQAGAAAGSAQAAAGSAQTAGEHAQDAEEFAELARQYAEIGIQPNTDYSSLDELPRPGSTKFIYMIPNSNTEPVDSYSEYLWVPDKSDYEFIGSTKIDLTDYAKQNGTYSDLTAGKAVRLSQSVKFQATNSAGGKLGWFKLATVSGAKLAAINGTGSYSATLLINGINEPALSFGGIVEIDCRIESSQIVTDSNRIQPKILCGGLREEYICAVPNTETNELDVYFLMNASYAGYSVTVIDEGYTRLMQPSETAITLAGTFYNAEAPSGAVYAVNVNSAATAEMLSSTQLQSADDLNNLYGSEYYGKNFWWAGNGYPINAPYNSGGYLQVNNIAGYTLQAAYIFSVKSDNNLPTEYQRVKGQNGVWSEWEEIATSEGTYPNLTAGKSELIQCVALNSGDDLNNCVPETVGDTQTWYCPTITIAQTILNIPYSGFNKAFRLDCTLLWRNESEGLMRAIQTLYAGQSVPAEQNVYVRSIDSSDNGTTWTPWEEIVSSNGSYPDLTAGKAISDAAGNDISETYAKQSGNYPDLTAGKAGKAEGDVRGTAIAENYVKVSSSRGTVSFFLGNIAVNVTLSVSNLTVDSLSVGDCVLANVTVLGTEYVVLLKMMSVSSESSGMGKVCAFGVTSSFNSSGTYPDLTAGDSQSSQKSRYIHNITVKSETDKGYISLQIRNDTATKYTERSELSDWLEINGFLNTDNLYYASGGFYTAQGIAPVVGVYKSGSWLCARGVRVLTDDTFGEATCTFDSSDAIVTDNIIDSYTMQKPKEVS